MKKQANSSGIGERLKEIRKKNHIQQKEMAAALNVAASYLCEIENGNAKPGPDFFIKLANVYNVNLNYLLLGSGDMFGIGNNIKQKAFDLKDGIESVEELFFLIEKSKYFKNLIMTLANKAVIEDEEIIIKGIQMTDSKPGNI
ncbi:MAG: helix-turn-helix domain-containing protein [Acidobacteria bacterium]|jgi:transcriptional regulator with XRE-family HTH domain|nr:helix-turn-helix domain-containing protein [Acidobacteriota bacterium]